MIGDFNAKIGRGDDVQSYIGRHSLNNELNDNVNRLLDFAIGAEMVIGSTKFGQ